MSEDVVPGLWWDDYDPRRIDELDELYGMVIALFRFEAGGGQ